MTIVFGLWSVALFFFLGLRPPPALTHMRMKLRGLRSRTVVCPRQARVALTLCWFVAWPHPCAVLVGPGIWAMKMWLFSGVSPVSSFLSSVSRFVVSGMPPLQRWYVVRVVWVGMFRSARLVSAGRGLVVYQRSVCFGLRLRSFSSCVVVVVVAMFSRYFVGPEFDLMKRLVTASCGCGSQVWLC